MPPFFIAPLFLILKDTERLGCLKWNSLKEEGEERKKINTIFLVFFLFFCTQMISVGTLFFLKYKELEIKARDPLHRVRDQRE